MKKIKHVGKLLRLTRLLYLIIPIGLHKVLRLHKVSDSLVYKLEEAINLFESDKTFRVDYKTKLKTINTFYDLLIRVKHQDYLIDSYNKMVEKYNKIIQ